MAASSGRYAAQANWHVAKIGGHLALCYIYQMNRVNSVNGSA